MALKYQIVPVTPFAQNCSIVWCDDTMKGIVTTQVAMKSNLP